MDVPFKSIPFNSGGCPVRGSGQLPPDDVDVLREAEPSPNRGPRVEVDDVFLNELYLLRSERFGHH